MTGFNMKREIAVKLTNITKSYNVHHDKNTLVGQIARKSKEMFTSLNKVNLTIYKGEKVGIIGRNGTGKTTLLKIISGVTTPTSGKIIVNGKPVAIIDLEAGFHSELSGIQNIYLNGMLLGMNKSEVKDKINKIVRFADIKDFINAPLFTYSTGMKLRLGFAVAIHSNPDILVLDEGLQVGDESFRRKSDRSIISLLKQNKTLITVTHNFNTIRNHCNRVIILDNGKIVADGGVSLIKYYKDKFT